MEVASRLAALVLVFAASTVSAQFATGFEENQSSGSPGYGNGRTLVGKQDAQAPAGNLWADLFGGGSASIFTSNLGPSSGQLSLRMYDDSTTAPRGIYVDLAGTPGLDFTKPFTVSFAMGLGGVSANTDLQAQVYLGAASTSLGTAKYWAALVYNNGSLNLYVSTTLGNGVSPVSLGTYSEFANDFEYIKVSLSIDPVLKKYTRVTVSGSKKAKDCTKDVQAVNGGVIPWLPGADPALPESKLVFVTGSNDTLTAKFDDIHVSNTGQWFEAFAPGVLLADEGTIEFTTSHTRPMSEFGNSWGYDFLFRAIPAQHLDTGRTLFGLCVPAANGGTGLLGVARNASGSVAANAAGFAPAQGTPTRVAMTWKGGAGGGVKLFVNGTQAASASASIGAIGPIPATFRIARLDPFNVSEVKVSDTALTPSTLSGTASVPFVKDDRTTMLATNNLTRTEYFRSDRLATLGYSSLTPRWRPEDLSLVEGTAPNYYLVGVNHSGTPKTYSVRLTATDHTGATAYSGTTPVTLAANKTHHVLSIPLIGLTARGHYKVHAEIVPPGGPSAAYDNPLALFPADSPADDGRLDRYLGHHYPLEDYSPAVLNRMGIKTNRVFGDLSGFHWYAVQPVEGTGTNGFTWTRTDLMVDSARAAGIDLVGILGGPPRWAATDPGYPGPFMINSGTYKTGHGLLPGRWKPRSNTEWSNYVFQVVSRYKNAVKHWEIWNEVDFHPPFGRSFSGETSEYAALLQHAYNAIKVPPGEADSSANVLTSGFAMIANHTDVYMPYDLLTQHNAAQYFDTLASHGYDSGYVDGLNTALYAKKGPDAPHWMTEQMWDSIKDEKTRLFMTIYLYLRYIDQGVDRFYQFSSEADQICFDHSSSGPKIDTYVQGVFQSHLRKADGYQGKYTSNKLDGFGIRHHFTRKDGKTLSILGQQSAFNRITVSGTGYSVVDIYGRDIPVTGSGGSTIFDVKNVAYIVSNSPLNITSVVEVEPAPLLLNTDFTEIQGDLQTGGLASCTPLNWSLRKVDDPNGSIVMTNVSNSGPYAMQVTTTGAGPVYVSQNARISEPGTYKVTAWVRRPVPGQTAVPYIGVWNLKLGTVVNQTFPNVVPGGAYMEVTATCSFAVAPTDPLAIMVGARNGTGTVLVDDVTFIRTGP